MNESPTWLANQLCHGDEEAVSELLELYFERLVKLAQKKYREKFNDVPRPTEDEEDAAQSAFASLCRRARAGKLRDFANRHELWKLLAKIVIRKVFKQRDRANTEQRGGGKAARPLGEAINLIDTASGPQLLAIQKETLAELMDALGDARLTRIAQMKLDGNEPQEIADELGISTRTVFRELDKIRRKWQEHLETDERRE